MNAVKVKDLITLSFNCILSKNVTKNLLCAFCQSMYKSVEPLTYKHTISSWHVDYRHLWPCLQHIIYVRWFYYHPSYECHERLSKICSSFTERILVCSEHNSTCLWETGPSKTIKDSQIKHITATTYMAKGRTSTIWILLGQEVKESIVSFLRPWRCKTNHGGCQGTKSNKSLNFETVR